MFREEGSDVAAKRVSRKTPTQAPIVTFDFENRTYQIDPDRRKVYRRFVEIETAKAFEIISVWRERQV